jgi:hypothetical protein
MLASDQFDITDFVDCTRIAQRHIDIAANYLEIECDKLLEIDQKMEARRIDALRKILKRVESDIDSYRSRISSKMPDLVSR